MSPLFINLANKFNSPVGQTCIVGDCNEFWIKTGKIVNATKGIKTDNINSCTAGLLSNGDKNFVFHVAPELQPLNTIKQEFEKQLENLKNFRDDIRGIIYGGWCLDNNDSTTIQSFNLYNKIADVLDALGVKFTMICGKDKNTPMDNLYVKGNRIVLINKGFNINKNEELSQDNIIASLEDKYQIVEKNYDDIFELSD